MMIGFKKTVLLLLLALVATKGQDVLTANLRGADQDNNRDLQFVFFTGPFQRLFAFLCRTRFFFLFEFCFAPTITTTSTTPMPTTTTPHPGAVQSNEYSLVYTGSFDRSPSNEEFAEVAELTRIYLQEFQLAEFEKTSLTILDDFLTVKIGDFFEVGQPVQIVYSSTALFDFFESILFPAKPELDRLIAGAFLGENLAEYLSRIQNLPSGNIFSTVTAVSIPGVTNPGSITTLAPPTVTTTPTPEDTITIILTAYTLSYTVTGVRIPSNEELAVVSEVTRVYLKEFQTAEFDKTSIIVLVDFLTVKIRESFGFGHLLDVNLMSWSMKLSLEKT